MSLGGGSLKLTSKGKVYGAVAPVPVSASPTPLPLVGCIHRGQTQVRTVPCELCQDRGKPIPVFSCAVHGECTKQRYKPVGAAALACCAGCPDKREQAQVILTDPQHLEAHLRLQSRVTELLSTPVLTDTGSGRGIVMGAGGPKYFGCAYAALYVLRKMGCTLPVELWHLGPEEINPQMRNAAQGLQAVFRDARAITPRPRILNGWELKPWSVIHSSFQEVMYLDADNIVVRDPAYLFDDPTYLQHGAAFWPDLPPHNRPEWVPKLAWDIAGVPITNRGLPAFETGQYMIDKARCWKELQLTMYINEWSDFWYKIIYGDKDTFKLAWHRLGRSYAMPARKSAWIKPAIQQYDFQGKLIFTHACQGKPQLISGKSLSPAAVPNSVLASQAFHHLQLQ